MKERKINVLKVEPKKEPEVVLLDNNLRALQEAVSIGADCVGLIEILPIDTGVCLLLNEEGKLIGLEPNRRFGRDILCGVFYVVGEDEEGNLTSLSEEAIEHYKEYFRKWEDIDVDEVEETIDINFIVIKD